LSANSRTESLSKKADISLGYGLFRVVLFSSPSEKNAITPLDGASCWNALPHNGWKRLGNVGFGIEAEMPIERARLCREGGTHHKFPRVVMTRQYSTKSIGFGDQRATPEH